ncbi:MAG: MFS transporter [Candidatus Natronoplasma sp.]
MVDFGLVSENRNFALLWASHLTSSFGDGLRRVALPWLVYILTGSPVQLGISFAFGFLPDIFVSPITGYYVDKISRKKILFFSYVANGLVILLLPVSNYLGFLNIYMVYIAMVGLHLVGSFFYEARFSVIPDLVGKERLDEANSFLYSNRALISLFSVTSAGVLIEIIGINITFIIDSFTFFLGSGIISLAAIPHEEKSVPKGLIQKVNEIIKENKEALKEMRHTIIEKIVIIGIPLNFATVPFILVFTDIAHGLFGSAMALSGLLFAEGVGRLVGNYAVNKVPWKRVTKCWAGILIMAIFVLTLGITGLMIVDLIPVYPLPILIVFALLVILIEIGQPIMNVASDSVVQSKASDENRGKILALSDGLLNIPFPFASLVVGIILSWFSPFLVLLLLGSILLLTAISAKRMYSAVK